MKLTASEESLDIDLSNKTQKAKQASLHAWNQIFEQGFL